MWQPTIAAVSVFLDSADTTETIQHALDGLLSAAKIASFHRVSGVMDNMIASLSRFAAILDPANPKPALTFGENEKARRATQTMFIIANRCDISSETQPTSYDHVLLLLQAQWLAREMTIDWVVEWRTS